jgi:hypothetical protein
VFCIVLGTDQKKGGRFNYSSSPDQGDTNQCAMGDRKRGGRGWWVSQERKFKQEKKMTTSQQTFVTQGKRKRKKEKKAKEYANGV